VVVLFSKRASLLASANAEVNDMPVKGFGEIAEQLRRSTVLIHSGGRGNGSGVIWSSDGVIITNAHVLRSARLRVQLWDGREFDAAVDSRDVHRDLAKLQVDATNLPAASPGDSSKVRVGELAIAIGNPLGFVGALTTGIIHAVGPIRGLGGQSWVQADLRLAPGNSGGPLADAHGRIIGINTMVAGRLALAIPSNAVASFLSAGSSDTWLGVTLHPVQVPRTNGRGKSLGLLLVEVQPNSPAARASLLPGDILLGTEGSPFTSLEDLAAALQGNGARLLRLEFWRGDYSHVRRVTVQLGRAVAVGSSVAA
jgi:serine protease Do